MICDTWICWNPEKVWSKFYNSNLPFKSSTVGKIPENDWILSDWVCEMKVIWDLSVKAFNHTSALLMLLICKILALIYCFNKLPKAW